LRCFRILHRMSSQPLLTVFLEFLAMSSPISASDNWTLSMPNNDLFTFKSCPSRRALTRTIIELGARRSGDILYHARARPCCPGVGGSPALLASRPFPTPSGSGIPRSPSGVARPSSRTMSQIPRSRRHPTPPLPQSSVAQSASQPPPGKTPSPRGRSPALASARTHRQNEQGIYPHIYPTENR
jgi:hypothetical protein